MVKHRPTLRQASGQTDTTSISILNRSQVEGWPCRKERDETETLIKVKIHDITDTEASAANGRGGWNETMGKDGGVMGEKEHKPGSYSQFLHLFHAHRHAAHFLGGHVPATGQAEHTHAGVREIKGSRRGIKKGRDISETEGRVMDLTSCLTGAE